MQFFYCFANTSLVLRVIRRLQQCRCWHVNVITVFYLGDRWALRVRIEPRLPMGHRSDLLAFLSEQGWKFQPTVDMQDAIAALDEGLSPTTVMNKYHVVIVSHGRPEPTELNLFREHFIEGLGYCPQSLA